MLISQFQPNPNNKRLQKFQSKTNNNFRDIKIMTLQLTSLLFSEQHNK